MKYIKIENENIIYPYNPRTIIVENPSISFPNILSEELLEEWQIYKVVEIEKPVVSLEKYVIELKPVLIENKWTQQWQINNYTQEELDQILLEKRQNMVVTMRQARLALRKVGLLSLVDDSIDLLPEPDRTDAKIEWEYAQEVQRLRPFVLDLQPLLGLTDEQLDQLFELASTL